jgi:uncharacterized protein
MDRNVLLTGGSGLVGRHLAKALKEKGYNVSILSRNPEQDIMGLPVYRWDIRNKIIDERALAKADYIIHLAGASVAERKWSQENKREIVDSRIKSSELIYYNLKSNRYNVKTVVSASGVGYYGQSGDRLMTEDSIAGYDFLANTCKQWEHAVNKMGELGIRTVNIRTGFVIARDGGAVPSLSTPIKLYMGAPFGEGNQYISWIHIDDLVNIYIKAMEDEKMKGPYNAAAPHPVTNKDLIRAMAKILNKPLWLPSYPADLLKFFLGEKASLVLSSINVSSAKIEKAGYRFIYPELEAALKNVLTEQEDNA